MTTTEIREAFEALITQAKAGVLSSGSAGTPVQKAAKLINGFKVEVRINVGAETWWIVNTGIASGYVGTNYAEAIGTLVLAS
jgi:hypothetical protein